jgi:hypothetical protein
MATVFLVLAVFGLLSIMRTGRLNSAAVPAGVRVSPGILAP